MAATHSKLLYLTFVLSINMVHSTFSVFPTELPVSPFYSISAIWNNHLYILDGKIGFNASTTINIYNTVPNTGLYSFDLSSLNITYIPNTNNISIKNTKNTKWVYTPHQLPPIRPTPGEEYGMSVEWQAYTQINDLIYLLSPETSQKYMLIYDLSIPRWTTGNINSNNPIINTFAACATNNRTHIFSIGGYTTNINDTGYSQIYDINYDRWIKTSLMANIRLYASGCAYSYSTNNIYSFGGHTYKSWYSNYNYDNQIQNVYWNSNKDDTDIILKYDTSSDLWSIVEKRLPQHAMGLFCYDLQLTHDIYCMDGMNKDYNGAMLQFDVTSETIAIIDHYGATFDDKYYPMYGFMSSFSYYESESYALLYVMGGMFEHGSREYYMAQVDYKLFTAAKPTTPVPTATPTNAPTNSPTNAPTKPTMLPTRAPTRSPTNSPTGSPTKTPTTKIPTDAPTRSPTATPTDAPTHSPTVSPTASIPGLPNYFSTAMGKAVLVVIGLCIVFVIVGLVIYFKSNDVNVKQDIGSSYFRETPTNDTLTSLTYLTNDTDTFSL